MGDVSGSDLRNSILASANLAPKLQRVPCPEWGTDSNGDPVVVFVRGMTAGEMDRVQIIREKKPTELMRRLTLMVVVDEEGRRLFQPNDLDALSNVSGAPLKRILEASQTLSGLSPEDLQTMEGNSEASLDDV